LSPWLLIDVVMETDTAGLELCQYIREKMKNQLTRIYIRTGQPGIAPERTVDRPVRPYWLFH